MTERVLITGASGFLGYHLVLAGLENNLEVFAAVRSSSKLDHLKTLPVTFVFPDYSDVGKLVAMLKENNIDYIIHAAGITKAVRQQDYNDINATNSVNLAKAAEWLHGGLKKMIFISSLAAAGPLPKLSGTITDTTEPAPVTAYGRSKLLAEKQMSKLNIPLTILRPTAVYGPMDKDIFIIIKTISQGLDPYMGSLKQRLSFVHAADVAIVAVQALRSPATGIFNISDGNSYGRYDFADTVKKILNKKAVRFHISVPVIKLLAYCVETTNGWMNKPSVINREKLNELMAVNWYCDISKAKQELNFRPKFGLSDGLKDSIEWYREKGWLK